MTYKSEIYAIWNWKHFSMCTCKIQEMALLISLNDGQLEARNVLPSMFLQSKKSTDFNNMGFWLKTTHIKNAVVKRTAVHLYEFSRTRMYFDLPPKIKW